MLVHTAVTTVLNSPLLIMLLNVVCLKMSKLN